MKSRVETLLTALLNGESANIKPRSRMEKYLLALINGDTNINTPQSRIEAYLYALCKKGPGGSGITNNDIDAFILRNYTEITNDRVTTIGRGVFAYHGSLTSVSFPKATQIVNFAFENCSALTNVDIPNVTHINNTAFSKCAALTIVDLPSTISLGNYVFNDCKALTTLILRSTSPCTLGGGSSFANTPILAGTGKIYVPRTMADGSDGIETYKALANWSTLPETVWGYVDEYDNLENT